MKKIIYSFINDEEIGINLKDDVKINILRILDNTKSKVNFFISSPIKINNNNIDSYSINFMSESLELIGYYTMSNIFKNLTITYIPDIINSNLIEDYRITSYSVGVTEYHLRQGNNGTEVSEYYYNGEEITEEEAYKIIKGKTK